MNLSFAGCGFLGMYHLGVANALCCHGSRLLLKVHRYGGASAGALIASALAVRGPETKLIEECKTFGVNLAADTQKKNLGLLTPRADLLAPLESFLRRMLPEDAHITASGRLYISVTNLKTRKNELISEFASLEDLVKCLLASSYVPFVTGTHPITFNKKKYIDGGLTDNLPLLPGGRTICVSPFSGKQDICPIDRNGRGWFTTVNNMDVQVNNKNIKRGLHAFFPPNAHSLQNYYQWGQNDAIRFLRREGLYSTQTTPST